MHKLYIVKDPTFRASGIHEETGLHVIEEFDFLKGLREACPGEQLFFGRLSSISMEVLLNFIGRTELLEGRGQFGLATGILGCSAYIRITLGS